MDNKHEIQKFLESTPGKFDILEISFLNIITRLIQRFLAKKK